MIIRWQLYIQYLLLLLQCCVINCEIISASKCGGSQSLPTTSAIAGLTALGTFTGFYFGADTVKCTFYECCNADTVKSDIESLQTSLSNHLYGQHLVQDTVVRSLKRHLAVNARPKKALVMSFHGWTGGGKNYVAQMIADHVYKKGIHSRFVHVFVSTLHFPHAHLINTYKDQIQQWIRGNTTLCKRSMFIFDEVDKMPAGLLETIMPYLDYHEKLDGVDFRYAVFILLSNTGGDDISAHALRAHFDGRRRESLVLAEMESVILKAAYNEDGGLQYSRLLKHHQIDHQIPFLPLTRSEVMLCARDYIRQRYGTKLATIENQRRVADMLQYFPDNEQLYSTSGCKKVPNKVELLLQQIEDELQSDEDDLKDILMIRDDL